MATAQTQVEHQRTDSAEACESIDVLITLSRKHDKRLARMSARLDVHDRRFQRIDQRFDDLNRLFRQADDRFDQLDDRFVQVEQRLDFISGQLAELLRKPAF
jgi:chromosome segregation ATPase